MNTSRRIVTITATATALLMAAGPALAYECVNASKKDQGSGAQIVLAGDFETILWTTPGVERRIAQGVIDPETGEGFHGIIGVDFDGDGTVDFATWTSIGPDGQIPTVAQEAGAECRGIVHAEDYFESCLVP